MRLLLAAVTVELEEVAGKFEEFEVK